MQNQTANTLIMIKPDTFGYNVETAASNTFQNVSHDSLKKVREKASKEFKTVVQKLRSENLAIIVISSPMGVNTPDAVFPNNWVSFHKDGTVIFYPMLALNRRLERQPEVIQRIIKGKGYKISRVFDMTVFEAKKKYLEGTGSLVIDPSSRFVFGIESPRTNRKLFQLWCREMGYRGFYFKAHTINDIPIYHTNVVMSVGNKFVVACLDAISQDDKDQFVATVIKMNKRLIPITLNQMHNFCGNIIEVISKKGKAKIIMSQRAFNSFSSQEVSLLGSFGKIISVNIPTIETIGGGSARCMLAEVFLPSEK